MGLPTEVREYIIQNIPSQSGLVGCRTCDSWSLECCEYDIAVFAKGKNYVAKVGPHVIKIVHFDKGAMDYIVEFGGMSIIKDSKTFTLSSALQWITSARHRKALDAFGRKSLVSSLFCQQKMKMTFEKNHIVASMWAKMAAYNFVIGTLALSGSRPMPVHELAQVRQANLATDVADGVQAALECIGIERATRPSIARSIKALAELKSKDFDKELFKAKVDHLLEKSMLADCYYFLGRVAYGSLAGRTHTFHNKYEKLIQLSMDLSSDSHQIEKLQKIIFKAAKKGLA